MKKLLFLFFPVFILLLISTTTFAAETVHKHGMGLTVILDTRLIINGKATMYPDIPITIEGRNNSDFLNISLENLASYIGIKNDKKNIQINKTKKTYTLIKDSKKLILTLDNRKATYDGKTIALDNAPTLVDNDIYLPAENIAALFGKKLVWNEEMKIIAITDNATYKFVLNALFTSQLYMEVASYKENITNSQTLNTDSKLNIQTQLESSKIDNLKHQKDSVNLNGKIINEESYLSNNELYFNSSLYGYWVKVNNIYGTSYDLFDLSKSSPLETIAACFAIKNGTSDTITLDGDIELYYRIKYDMTSDIIKPHTKFILDKSTYFPREIKTEFEIITNIDDKDLKFTSSILSTLTDMKGRLIISLPDELKSLSIKNQFEDFESKVKFLYPSEWKLSESTNKVQAVILSPLESNEDKYNENVTFIFQNFGDGKYDLDQFTALYLESLPSIITDFNKVSFETTTLDDLSANKIIFTFKQGELDLKAMTIWTVKNNKLYLMNYISEADKFEKFIETADEIIKTVRIP